MKEKSLEHEAWITQLTGIAVDLLSGCEDVNVRSYLTLIAGGMHTYPSSEARFEDVRTATRRAYKRVYGMKRSLTKEIEDYILTTSGNFSTTDVYQVTTLTTRADKKKAAVVLSRLKDKGIIKPAGNRNGIYTLVEKCEPKTWVDCETSPVKIWLPFELTDRVIILPGDISVFMGSPNSGKSAVLMNIAKENRDWHEVHYFSSEMRASTFKRRMAKFPDVSVDQLASIKFYDEITDYAELIKPGKGVLNIIDYIEIHDQFWQISGVFNEIYKKLDGAVCMCAVQKDPNKEFGLGGTHSQMKPNLSIALDKGIATITKLKEWKEGTDNLNWKQFKYKLVDGCRLMRANQSVGWHTKPKRGEHSHGI